MLAELKIGSVFIIDPTLKSEIRKPTEEDMTDAKILFFYPKSIDIYEKRK